MLALLSAACGVGTVADSSGPSAPSDTTGGNPGTIQRATLEVSVSFDPGDADMASQAGVVAAGLPVRATRQASSAAPVLATTDATGRARFESLLEGTYVVSVDRALTPAERAALPEADRDVSVFAGSRRLAVTPPSTSATVELVASRRGSLVLSEAFFSARANTVGTTGSAQYAEFYNASDTAIYLDGMLFFQTALNLHRAVLDQYECEVNSVERMDATGIWASFIWRFPGSGTTYRVAPGMAVAVAVDATDHRIVEPSLPDLRTAHFEFIGDPADPDNPGAANMVALTRHGAPSGNNLTHSIIIGVALPVAQDTTQLNRATIVNTSSSSGETVSVFSVPRSAILDLGAFALAPDREALLSGRTCDPFTSPVFDRAPARLNSGLVIKAIARKSLGFTGAGIEILQRTRTSERDFEYASPLRRSLRRQ